MTRAMPLTQGFTLVETIIALAIAGILASISYPSYVGQLQRSRRFDAMQALWLLQQSQERYRANHLLYGSTLEDIGIYSPTTSGGFYKLSLTGKPTGKSYLATATAIFSQTHDTSCNTLMLSVDQGTANQQPANCWGR